MYQRVTDGALIATLAYRFNRRRVKSTGIKTCSWLIAPGGTRSAAAIMSHANLVVATCAFRTVSVIDGVISRPICGARLDAKPVRTRRRVVFGYHTRKIITATLAFRAVSLRVGIVRRPVNSTRVETRSRLLTPGDWVTIFKIRHALLISVATHALRTVCIRDGIVITPIHGARR